MGLFIKKTNLIGLDIGTNAVKLIKLTGSPGDYTVSSISYSTLPVGAMQGGVVQSPSEVIESIHNARKDAKTGGSNCCLSVSSASSMIKTINIPDSFSEKDRESIVMTQASKIIPHPLNEVSLDFEVIGPSASPGNLDVLVVACRTDIVSGLVEVTKGGKLKPSYVDIESYAIERAYEKLLTPYANTPNNGAVALIELGDSKTSLYVLVNGKSVYQREHALGMHTLTEEISSSLNRTRDEARSIVASPSLEPTAEQKIIAPFVNNTAGQIKQFLMYFQASGHVAPIEQVLVCGGGAMLPNMAKAVETVTGISTRVANPFLDMKYKSHMASDIEQHGAAMLVAAGLSLRDET